MKRVKNINSKIVNISVGISAFNEASNIQNVLKDIVDQTQNGWKLNEILLYCDGCQDNTFKLARKLSNSKIKIFEFSKRHGKVFRTNQILQAFQGDILIIFDADIRLRDDKVINHLVEEFKHHPKVAVVGGNARTFPPKTFFQKAIYTSYQVYFKSREKIKGGHSVYACSGACLVLRKSFAKKITIPADVIAEDTFIYFSCIKRGYKFKQAKDAVVYFKMASNLKDFLRQMFRSHPESLDYIYGKYFGKLIQEEYKRPMRFYLKSIFQVFLKNPLGTIYMIVLKLLCKPFYIIFSKNYKLQWFTAASTK